MLVVAAISYFYFEAVPAIAVLWGYALVLAISLYISRQQVSRQLTQYFHHLMSNQKDVNVVFYSRWLRTIATQFNEFLSQISNERDGYVATLDAIKDAVIRTDKTGKIIAVNNACLLFFGCEKQRLIHNDYDFCQRAIEVAKDHLDFLVILEKLSTSKDTKLYKSIFHVDMNNRKLAIERQVSAIYENDVFIGTVVVLRDVTKAEKLRKRLRYQANHDNVTKLYNRYKFEQRLADAWHDAQEKGTQHALLQMDMDRFKLINDNAGHAAGDQLLRDVAGIIKSNVRTSDVCARIGGDEFSILLYSVTDTIVLDVMNKLNTALKNYTFSASGQIFDVSASIGATLINKGSPALTELKRQADAACFIAKNKGINNNQLFCQYDSQLMSFQQEPRWAARIHKALESDEFALFYQPIQAIDSENNPKQHIEILLRLKSGDELLSPNVFLPAVERFRLTDKVDFWVVSKAFSWFEQQSQLWEKQVIAINLSADSLTNELFINQVLACHQSHHFPASAVCFEITETAAIANMKLATRMVEKLREAGFNIALDDFGKGFSTFSYLKSLPAQYIKIDGSYVEEILINKRDHSIVKAIATMAKTMEMKTIAEFVQCGQTMELLSELGVDFVQGYGISMPKPLADYHQQIELH